MASDLENDNAIRHGVKASIEAIHKLAEERGGKLLSTTYKNALSPLTWQCGCGNVFIATLSKVRNRGQWCPKCGLEKGLNNMRKRFNEDESIRQRISCSHRGIDISQFDGYRGDDVVWQRAKKRKLCKRRYDSDLNYRIKCNLRSRLYAALRGKKKISSAVSNLGCTIEEFIAYLESKFQPGMNWDNHSVSGWHIDHIRPLASFDLTDTEQFKVACHYTNLQPMWAADNIEKSDKYEEEI